MLNIVLLEPEIPSNTGNIVRTCAATGCRLHLIGPLGFSVSDKELKRAGLDYWPLAEVEIYEDIGDFYAKNPERRDWFASTKAALRYDEADYREGDYLWFGRETKGLPEPLILGNIAHAIRIPMRSETRSLNLSNSAAIVIYEALRHFDFESLQTEGKFGPDYGKTR